jgi:hypothetical protein
VASRPAMHADPEVGIPDLIRRLTDDSKRLARDEVRLAKMEVRESIRTGTRGAVWLGVAFGAMVIALVALTFMLTALLGRALGNYWAGALVTGALELVAALVLVKRGLRELQEPSYTFEQSREALRDTKEWARQVSAEAMADLRVAGRADAADAPRIAARADARGDARTDFR